MIACIRAAIEVNEFMSLLTSLEGRRRNDHATRHESGMGRPRSWVECEIQRDYLGDLSALLLKCRVLVSGECIIDVLCTMLQCSSPLLPSLCSMLVHEQLMWSFGGSPLNLLLRINAHVTQALHNALIYLPYTARCTDLHHLALLVKVVHYGHARLDKSFESLLNALLIIITPPTGLSSV